MKKLYSVLSFLLITNLITLGQVPQATSFQGVLADSEGTVVADGTYSLNFKLYDAAADGTMLWEETQVGTTVNGVFNVILGKVIKLDLPFDKQYWLEISIDGGDPLLPRIELTSSPYSLNTKSIPNNIVTAEKVADSNLVRSINSLKDNVTIVAGSNVVITDSNNTITISAVGGGAGDNLGDHTATQNIKLNGNYLSGDGDNQGVFVASDGKVGIGTTTPISQLQIGDVGDSLYGLSVTTSMGGVHGTASNTGVVTNYGGYFTANGKYGSGVFGVATGISGKGVYGTASNTGVVTNYGGYFTAKGKYSRGVLGSATGTSGIGVYGNASNSGDVTNYGGYFITAGTSGNGVFGGATGSSGIGVYGTATNSGLVTNYGGYFSANGKYGSGIYGAASGLLGTGVSGEYTNNGNYGSLGNRNSGVYGYSPGDGTGVYGKSESGYAGAFAGNVQVMGTLSKGGGSFKIDHPLDPTNKNLYHSFVESPDMKNIYDGNVTTDANGNAEVELPEWFEALNKDFRYQLTVIGEFAQAIISQKIKDNRFSIKTDKSNVEVSWLVTGIRKDAFANANRIPVEEMKKSEDKGKYIHPKAFGMPETMSVDYNEELEQERMRTEQEHAEMEKIRMEEKTKDN